jgi:hypothetical protein
MLYIESKGGMSKSAKLAVKFFEKACKEGSQDACKLAEKHAK